MSEQYEIIDDGREFNWDDEIKNDGPAYVLLPAGEYPFTVTKFERARHPGSSKLPPCPMALLTIAVHSEKGDAILTTRLFLHTRTEGLLCAFFESIGQRKHGDPLRPRWNEVVGSNGQCKIGIREYEKRDKTLGTTNEITRFLPPPEMKAADAPAWQQGAF